MGPDGIPGRVLKACAFQLAGDFTDIFNLPLSLSVVHSCFKKSTIVPIPKKKKITCLNDWRPIALTPIFSKCFEQGSKLLPFWSHMLPKCNLCDSKIYLGAFVRVQIIAVVRPLQFSAKRSRITAQHVPRDRELKQVKLFIPALV